MKKIKTCAFLLTLIFAVISPAKHALSFDFPKRSMEWLAPYGVAANSAIGLKVIADYVSRHLPKPVFVVPAKGAGGTLAGDRMANRIKADGYTLILANSGTNGVSIFTKKVNYTNNNFKFIAQYGAFDLGLIAKNDAPFSTLEEYIEYAKKNPNKIKQASTGVGTSGHLLLELLKLKAGNIKIDMVPFRSAFELRTAVLGGHCQASFIYGGAGGPNDSFRKTIDGGGKILAVTSEKRLPAYPNVPTFAEKGYDVIYSAWYGIAGPKGMPEKVSEILKKVIYQALEDPKVVKSIKSLGFRYEFRKSEDFTAYVKRFCDLVKMVVKEANIPVK